MGAFTSDARRSRSELSALDLEEQEDGIGAPDDRRPTNV